MYDKWALFGLLILQKQSCNLEYNSIETEKLMLSGASHTALIFFKK